MEHEFYPYDNYIACVNDAVILFLLRNKEYTWNPLTLDNSAARAKCYPSIIFKYLFSEEIIVIGL